jgi:hypothetical protein
MCWAGHVAHVGERRHFGGGNLSEGDHLKNPSVGIKMDLQEVGCEGMDLIYVTQDRDR